MQRPESADFGVHSVDLLELCAIQGTATDGRGFYPVLGALPLGGRKSEAVDGVASFAAASATDYTRFRLLRGTDGVEDDV